MGHRVGICRPHGASSNDNDDVNDVDRQPVYADQVEPVYADQVELVYADQVEPVYTDQVKPVYADQVEPVYADQVEPVNADQVEPVNADQVEPVDTEAEALLQYIATFNELMTTGKYKQAATHAANSPDGVLRTSATFQRFKGGSQLLAGRRKHHLPLECGDLGISPWTFPPPTYSPRTFPPGQFPLPFYMV